MGVLRILRDSSRFLAALFHLEGTLDFYAHALREKIWNCLNRVIVEVAFSLTAWVIVQILEEILLLRSTARHGCGPFTTALVGLKGEFTARNAVTCCRFNSSFLILGLLDFSICLQRQNWVVFHRLAILQNKLRNLFHMDFLDGVFALI